MKSIQKGKAVSHGIGIGKVYIYKHYVPNIQKKVIEQKDIKKELESFDDFIFKPLKITNRKGSENIYFPPIAKRIAKISEK